MYLVRQGNEWARALLSLVKAHDAGKVSDSLIADELARINFKVHLAVTATVGPRCIVVWRRRHDARTPGPGGAHYFYTGLQREQSAGPIPTIGNGIDLRGILGLLLEDFGGRLNGRSQGDISQLDLAVDPDEMNRRLAELPSEPDDKLR